LRERVQEGWVGGIHRRDDDQIDMLLNQAMNRSSHLGIGGAVTHGQCHIQLTRAFTRTMLGNCPKWDAERKVAGETDSHRCDSGHHASPGSGGLVDARRRKYVSLLSVLYTSLNSNGTLSNTIPRFEMCTK
jgi:hypothetical protein